METTKKLKFLLAGPGLIGKKHAELLSRSERSELVCVVAPKSAPNIEFAEKYGVPFFETLEQAFGAMVLDAAIIASPNEFHCEQALACMSHRIPALVEKPLAPDLQSAYRIFEESRKSGVPILVGHHRTYSPLLPAARDFIASSEFGNLVSVQGSALFHKPAHYYAEGPWRTRIGGGPILINLIHEVGIMQYLCGPIQSVFAQASNRRRNFEVEDTVVISLTFENGALGSFLLSDIAASNKSWEMTSGENPAYPHYTDADCYHFAGSNGSLDFPTMRARYYGENEIPSWWNKFHEEKIHIESTDPLKRQLEHFEDVVADNVKPIVSAELGLANLRVLEAVRTSIRTGKSVDVAEMVQ